MQETYVECLGKILKNKKKFESELGVKISNKGRLIFVEGEGDKEYLAIKILGAVNLGFSVDTALLLKDEEIIMQILNIKDITKRNDLERVRGRIIGTYRKTLDNIENLSDCSIVLHGNQVGVIGSVERIDDALIAVKSLIQGSKQGNVYARLEREKKKKRLKSEEIIKPILKKEKANLF